MGEVYRARDTRLKRDVAIKVLPAYCSRGLERLERFELEARAAAALNHPNITSIFHVGQRDGSHYMVTELLQGETLRERLRRGPILDGRSDGGGSGIAETEELGLFATIGPQCLTVVNAALMVAIPANRARFQEVIGTATASINAHQPQPFPFVFPIWVFLALSFPVVCVILWFLITQRQSFASASQNLVRQLP
jgi:hypothetical protein